MLPKEWQQQELDEVCKMDSVVCAARKEIEDSQWWREVEKCQSEAEVLKLEATLFQQPSLPLEQSLIRGVMAGATACFRFQAHTECLQQNEAEMRQRVTSPLCDNILLAQEGGQPAPCIQAMWYGALCR